MQAIHSVDVWHPNNRLCELAVHAPLDEKQVRLHLLPAIFLIMGECSRSAEINPANDSRKHQFHIVAADTYG